MVGDAVGVKVVVERAQGVVHIPNRAASLKVKFEESDDDVQVPADDVGPGHTPQGFVLASLFQNTLDKVLGVLETIAHKGRLLGVVESIKEFELMHHEKYGDLRDKRSHTLGQFSSTSSGGRASFSRDFFSQHDRPVQAVMQTAEGGYSGHSSYGSG
ncbi:hypothetical protein T459_09289 [Capsicum annuum]|uniref:Uncharacterized protein n=1 Tax=Capsicum annuum TaxID=4072 RepID=A0A2G2ZYY0_CAPAN|nr:hypothetical protein T459_09289 [Capsicum annuum]